MGKVFSRWSGDGDARRAVYNNRARLLSGVAKAAFKLRAEVVERGFAQVLDRGGMRRTWLRGRENVHERYVILVAGHNLELLMRLMIGAGTPKEAIDRGKAFVLLLPLLAPFWCCSRPSPATMPSLYLHVIPRLPQNKQFVNGLLYKMRTLRKGARLVSY